METIKTSFCQAVRERSEDKDGPPPLASCSPPPPPFLLLSCWIVWKIIRRNANKRGSTDQHDRDEG